jgi:CRP-like cAMP-binding protein
MPTGIKPVLGKSRLFAGLDDRQLGLVLEHGSLKQYPGGRRVLAEGQRDHGLQIIVAGRVAITLPKAPGRLSEVSLCVLSEGDYFGEYSLLDDQPASAAADAVGPCEIFTIPRGQFGALMDRDDNLGKKVYHNMLVDLVARARRANRDLDMMLG